MKIYLYGLLPALKIVGTGAALGIVTMRLYLKINAVTSTKANLGWKDD